MRNLQFGFWTSLIGSMISMVMLPGSLIMFYLIIIAMTFLTGIFVLKEMKKYVPEVIATTIYLEKNGFEGEKDEQKDSSL